MEHHEMVSDLYQKNMQKAANSKKWRNIVNIIFILLGSFILAINMNTFVEQGKLVPGGFSGLSKLIQRVGLNFYDVKISFTLLNVIFNAIPAVFAYRLVGKKFTVFSCLSLLVVSVLVDELPVIPITGDILLISVFGGILNGLGLSLILNNNASSGGTDFIAMSLSNKYKVSTFNYMLLFSAVIILISGRLFGMDKALYSIIFQYTSTQVLHILYKRYQKQTLIIVTKRPEDVYEAIAEITHHDATLIKGEGCYSKQECDVLYSVVGRDEVNKVVNTVRKTDPQAFVNMIRTENLAGRFYQRPND